MRLKVLSLYFPKEIEEYRKSLFSLKKTPKIWNFFIGKQQVFSLEEYQETQREKDLGFDEVFFWLWNMSEIGRYPSFRTDFFREEMIEALERAKREGEFLERGRS